MKQFSVGRHVTSGGHEAIVARLTQIGGEWALKGSVICPFTLAYVVTYWSLNGVSIGLKDPSLNLAVAG